MRALWLPDDQLSRWDAFVTAHSEGTIYHRSDWKRILEGAYHHLRGYVLVLVDPDTDSILAGVPVYHATSRLLGDRLVCAPYSTWCSPLVSHSDHLRVLLGEIRDLASRSGATRAQVRCRGQEGDPLPDWTVERKWKHHVIQLNRDRDAVWDGLARTAVRQMVRKAQRDGISVAAGHDEGAMRLFYAALVETRRRLGLPMLPYRYFASLQQTLSQDIRTILVARRAGRVLGAALTLTEHGICHLELTGEYSASRRSGAMQLLVWEAIERAYAAGCYEFSFGRTGPDNVGLLRYKRRWNTREEDLSTLTWVGQGAGESVGAIALAEPIAKWVLRRVPRPVYKRLGSFIYSHWA